MNAMSDLLGHHLPVWHGHLLRVIAGLTSQLAEAYLIGPPLFSSNTYIHYTFEYMHTYIHTYCT